MLSFKRFALFCLLIAISKLCKAQNDKFITSEFLNYTIQLQYKDRGATGFAFRDSIGRCFIVTVRHLFVDKIKKINEFGKVVVEGKLPYHNADSVSLNIYTTNWFKIKVPVFTYNDTTDVAVLKVDNLISKNYFSLSTRGLTVSQDCFFLGYPLGKSTNVKGVNIIHPIPFVNKGVYSGSAFGTSNNMELIFVSASNTYGYSGGPVVFFDYTAKAWRICAIVNGYLNQDDIIEYDNGSSISYKENSGIMYATPIFFATDIINSIKL